jgi:putative ABC transport system substrate-binding protein
MAIKVARRKFISALGIVVAWPRTARAQTRRRLGLLFATSAQAAKARGLLEAVTQGLKEYGWVEGQNITFEYRFADGKEEVLPKLAAELVQLPMGAILTDGTPATQAAKKATRTVPIVMAVSNDPVASGFVASLNRPGGNITGTSLLAPDLAGRRLQLLTEMVPGLAHVAVLMNPSNPSHALLLKQTQAAAQSLSVELQVVEVAAPDKLDGAFAAITAARAGALIDFGGRVILWPNPPPRRIHSDGPSASALPRKAGRRSRRPYGLRPEYSGQLSASRRLRG